MISKAGEQGEENEKPYNSNTTVKEIAVRQKIDDRIRSRIEEPVVVPEDQLMESGEKSVPVKEGDKKSQKRHDRGNSGNDPEKAELLFQIRKTARGRKVRALRIRRI